MASLLFLCPACTLFVPVFITSVAFLGLPAPQCHFPLVSLLVPFHLALRISGNWWTNFPITLCCVFASPVPPGCSRNLGPHLRFSPGAHCYILPPDPWCDFFIPQVYEMMLLLLGACEFLFLHPLMLPSCCYLLTTQWVLLRECSIPRVLCLCFQSPVIIQGDFHAL